MRVIDKIEKIGEGIFGALKWEDWVMMRGHYARALSSFMQARGYKPIESRNYIAGFAYEVAHDIDMWLFYKDGADAWLKSIHKEYIAVEARDKMLTAFDLAFKKWQKRKQMSKEDIGKSRRETIDGINKTFRECSNIAHGVFFVDQLENIHR